MHFRRRRLAPVLATAILLLRSAAFTQSQPQTQIVAWGDIDQSDVPPGLSNVVGIAAGHFHNLSVTGDGRLFAWPLGQNDVASELPGSLTNIVRMAGGVAHDLALRADGTVAAWGDNSAGQTNVPPGTTNVVAVCAGGYHSLALRADGSLVAWGDNSYGQAEVPLNARNIVAIAAGFYHSMALRSDGVTLCWGDDSFGQTDVPGGLTNAVAIAAGGDHCLALTAGGKVVAWGDNSYGQSVVPSALTNAVAVAAGDFHSLALLSDRTVVAWGPPLNGATAIPSGLSNTIAIAAGGSHSLTLLQNTNFYLTFPLTYRTVLCGAALALQAGFPSTHDLQFQWAFNGANLDGRTNAELSLLDLQTNQTGIYSVAVSTEFGLVARLATLVTVVPSLVVAGPQSQTNLAGNTVTLNISALSTVPLSYQWRLYGTNLLGATNASLLLPNITPDQAGFYSVILSNSYGVITSPEADLNVLGIVQWVDSRATGTNVGNAVALAVSTLGQVFAARADGSVVGWSPAGSSGPVIPGQLSNVTAVAAGYLHTVALKADGTLTAWGNNYYGQTNAPPDLTNVVEIAAGIYHSLALRGDGSVTAWGSDFVGETSVPVDLGNVLTIAAGTEDSLAVTSDGQIVVWGNTFGGMPAVPAQPPDIVQLAAGDSHFLALHANGTVIAWGDNSAGQTNVPATLTNAVMVAAAGNKSLAMTSDGKVVAWGSGATRQTNVLASLSNVVSIALGAFSSAPNVALIGSGPPRLAMPLVSRSVSVGATTCFHVSATGLLPLSYQWQFDGHDLPGQTGPSLVLANVSSAQAGVYSVTLSNAAGLVGSGPAVLSVAPVLLNGVITQPYSHLIFEGGTASFVAVAQGIGLSYQWLSDGVAVLGATNSNFTLTNVQSRQAGNYAVAVSNSLGGVLSSGVPLQVLPLWIVSQPSNQTNYAGGNSVVTVQAAGSPPLSYQWLFNGQPLAGATNSSLALNSLQFSQAGDYSVIVSNAFGVTNSQPFSLNVQPSFVSVYGPDGPGATNLLGDQTYLYASILGLAPFTYQWFFNGTSLAGATNDNLSFDDLTPDQTGSYFIVVSNAYGVVTSAPVNLLVLNLVQWEPDSPQTPTFSAIPAELTCIAASSSGWAVASTADGAILAFSAGGVSAPAVPGNLSNAVSVAAGRLHGLVLKADGSVSAWGDNSFGQTDTPGNLSNVVSIAAGDFHNLALTSNGRVVAWGRNNFGQTNVPVGLSNAVAVAAATNSSFAVTLDGHLVGWGADGVGNPIAVPLDLANVIGAAASSTLGVTLRADGRLGVWQTGPAGQTYFPQTPSNIVAVAASSQYDLELLADGMMSSWANSTNTPAVVSNVVAVAAGGNNWALLGAGPPVLGAYVGVVSYDTNGFAVAVPTQSGRVYSLEYTDSLSPPAWAVVTLVAGNGQQVTLTDPARAPAQRFYRLRQW